MYSEEDEACFRLDRCRLSLWTDGFDPGHGFTLHSLCDTPIKVESTPTVDTNSVVLTEARTPRYVGCQADDGAADSRAIQVSSFGALAQLVLTWGARRNARQVT